MPRLAGNLDKKEDGEKRCRTDGKTGDGMISYLNLHEKRRCELDEEAPPPRYMVGEYAS